jgi:hypothetical protein
VNTLDQILAFPQTLGLLLKKLHRNGQLASLLREALADQLIGEQARKAGLSVTAEELQNAADSFRRRHGLHTAADTKAWLDGRGLSVGDFEEGLEQDLLAGKVRTLVTAEHLDRYWQANQAGYERLRLALVLVGREELAREIAAQVQEEGRDMQDVVREQGLALHRAERFRKDLGGPLFHALASAGVGELVGPVGTAGDFTLAVIEEQRPAELDKATRERIQEELFEVWLAEHLEQPVLNPGTDKSLA